MQRGLFHRHLGEDLGEAEGPDGARHCLSLHSRSRGLGDRRCGKNGVAAGTGIGAGEAIRIIEDHYTERLKLRYQHME